MQSWFGYGHGFEIQKVGCHEEFQAHFHGNLHVGHIFLVSVAVPVVKVVYHLFKYMGAGDMLASMLLELFIGNIDI